MSDSAPPTALAGAHLGDARHVCAFFRSEDEEYQVLLPFIRDGFDSGDRAIHVLNPDRREGHRRRLAEAGIDTAVAEAHPYTDDALHLTPHAGPFHPSSDG